MKMRSKAPILRNWQGSGHMSTEPPLASKSKPVLIIDEGPVGKPVGPVEAYGYGYEIIEASDDELELLRKGGYGIPYLGLQ